MKQTLWTFLFLYITRPLNAAVIWAALWVDCWNARAAFRAIGNRNFKNKRHNFVRFETIKK